MADHLHAWVRVLRGQGRHRHQAVGYERIRRYLSLALPVLRGWAETSLDLRQITATHIREELARRHAIQARGLHHVRTAVKYVNAAHPDKALPRVR